MAGTSTLRRETWNGIGKVAVARDENGHFVTWSPVVATDGGEEEEGDETAHITTRLERGDEPNIAGGETVHVTIERDDTGETVTAEAQVQLVAQGTIHLEKSGTSAGHVQMYAGFNEAVDEGSEINEDILGHYTLDDEVVGTVTEIEVAN